MNRRGFLGALAGIAATLTLDPEKLLWRPGEKAFFIPKFYEVTVPLDTNFDLINSTTLEMLRRSVVFDSLFVDTPFQARLRARSVESFDGGYGL